MCGDWDGLYGSERAVRRRAERVTWARSVCERMVWVG